MIQLTDRQAELMLTELRKVLAWSRMDGCSNRTVNTLLRNISLLTRKIKRSGSKKKA